MLTGWVYLMGCWTQLAAAAWNKTDESHETEPNSKVAGYKTKTMSSKRLKCSAELRGAEELGISVCDHHGHTFSIRPPFNPLLTQTLISAALIVTVFIQVSSTTKLSLGTRLRHLHQTDISIVKWISQRSIQTLSINYIDNTVSNNPMFLICMSHQHSPCRIKMNMLT